MRKKNEEFIELTTNLSQRDKILRHLKDYGTLTTLEAFKEYGIMRPSARVSELKSGGTKIKTRMIKGLNRYGEPIRYAEYSLVEEENNG